MHVSLDGEHIRGSPLVMRVAPGPCDPSRCIVEGEAQEIAEAGKLCGVDIHLYDAFSNRRGHADDPPVQELLASIQLIQSQESPNRTPHTPAAQFAFEQGGGTTAQPISMKPSRLGIPAPHSHAPGHAGRSEGAGVSISTSVSAHSNGSFRVTYTPRTVGFYAFNLQIDGVHVACSPFALSVRAGALHAASCDISGDLFHACVGSVGRIELVTRDRYGNRIRHGGHNFSVFLMPTDDRDSRETQKATVTGQVADRGDGCYSATYVCRGAGEYALSVCTLEGDVVRGSPFLLQVSPGAPSALHSFLQGGSSTIEAAAGEEVTLGFRLADAFGNRAPLGDAPMEVEVLPHSPYGGQETATSSPQFHVRAVAHGELCGMVVVRFFVSGEHEVHARLGSSPLQGSPALVNVHAAIPAAKRCHLIRAPEGMIVTASCWSHLVLILMDAWGNQLTRGNSLVSANVISPGASDCKVEDHGDGTSSVSWVTQVTGKCQVSVLVVGAHIQGSPFHFRVVAPQCTPHKRTPSLRTHVSPGAVSVWR
ncbi:hypothetical protein AB1Y20_022678 [Prymnesium parvum]|uniref:Uncharacterized protein n=1 Tax=Prymnesium parvum TaxID=97485 RepID=A0AB34JKA9_PRYPA